MSSSSSASWPASRIPSIPWKRPCRNSANDYLAADRAPARRLDADPGISALPETAGPVACVAIARRRRITSSRPRARPRPSPTCAIWTTPDSRGAGRPGRDHGRTGLRVLGVARAHFRKRDLPGEQHDFKFEFLGLVGLADPVRPTVPAPSANATRAGIRVVMITGDYPGTAQNIARQIGLEPATMSSPGPSWTP